jgi:predicted transcriptional regulator
MTPVHPILKEEDTINQAIYLMFKESVRQPIVVRKGEMVGVVDLMRVFSELLEIAGPECYVHWQS